VWEKLTMTENLILVVEDDPKLVHLLRTILTTAGFSVISTRRGEGAIELAALEQPELIILDITLSGDIDGYEVARRVRDFSDLPIVVLTVRSTEADILRGFDAGVDDYVTKPFSSKELLARVEAVLRRASQRIEAQPDAELICGDLHIDLARRRVRVGSQDVHLTRTEYNLLYELATHPNQVLLHEQLLSAVWGAEYRDDVEYLRAYIRYLRQKLEADPSDPKMIVTSPGVGYMLSCPEEPTD
jgi:two-component system KDP operon response regulator KdpE